MVNVQDIQPGTLMRWNRSTAWERRYALVIVIGIWDNEDNVYMRNLRFYCPEEERFWNSVCACDEELEYMTLVLWCT